ncbi:histidinol-phosphate aminotransferase [Methanosarcina spelaei]|uniref:Histidinol-phosphate aminotransferase n=1 Tax=Methanosarcina spelaei TaxID=1036679 RepID=A0A2A2HRM5_9EURY|nr:histidinol-phosphate transaminase [Methanosarcina spelaei]PAV11975.1 histidinol-phosphate aminotransferase [Methanosarcina spelaei]
MFLSRPELIKKEIFDIAEYVPGKSIEEIVSAYGLEPTSIIKLGSNENPLGPSPKAIQALVNVASYANIYPSADAIELREALSKYTGFPVSNLIASGPGMDGLLDGVCRLVIERGDEVIIPTPTFAYYELPARACGGKPVFVRRKQDFSIDPEKILEAASGRTKIIFLCSPNNPSGNLLPENDLRKILETTRALVFVDEAYVEFADRNLAGLVREYDNLVVGRTFSKVFGLAGLRLGYGIMPEWLAKEYIRAATPFSVSLPALKAGVAALSDTEHRKKSIDLARKGREYLKEKIPFKVYPSQANFVLVDVAPLKAKAVTQNLMKKGIIVRSCDSFRDAGDSFIRVTVGTPEQNEIIVRAFEAVKNEV